MKDKLEVIQKWLGVGSINIFGLPMSGKDTVGKRLAEELGARFLSSGDMIRAVETEQSLHMTDGGQLIPTDKFYDIVLPFFGREDIRESALVLSSVGRWSGEEVEVMKSAAAGGHEILVALELELAEEDARERWRAAQELADRGSRADDATLEIFETRITEYQEKTVPVLEHYADLGKLIKIDGSKTRDEVFATVIDALYEKAIQ